MEHGLTPPILYNILTGSHTVLCLATAGYVAAAKIMRGPAYLVSHLALLPPTVSHVPLPYALHRTCTWRLVYPVFADGISEGNLKGSICLTNCSSSVIGSRFMLQLDLEVVTDQVTHTVTH